MLKTNINTQTQGLIYLKKSLYTKIETHSFPPHPASEMQIKPTFDEAV